MATKTLTTLRRNNPDCPIQDVTHKAFQRYGRVLKGIRAPRAVAYARKHAASGEDVAYEPSVPGLEKDRTFFRAMESGPFGGMPIQIGWCYGHNSRLDGLEYHKGIEVVVAVTDAVVLLGHQQDIRWTRKGPSYASRQTEAFYLKQGTVVELHCWCLHFAPIHVSRKQGFCTLVVLPRETNTALNLPPKRTGEDALLFARNKWLLVHRQAERLVEKGAVPAITGRNTCIQPID